MKRFELRLSDELWKILKTYAAEGDRSLHREILRRLASSLSSKEYERVKTALSPQLPSSKGHVARQKGVVRSSSRHHDIPLKKH